MHYLKPLVLLPGYFRRTGSAPWLLMLWILVSRIPFNVFWTHWGRDKMVTNFLTTFSNAFPWMKMHKFRLRFHWGLFLRVQLTISQHWLRKWLGADQATSHYLNQWWLVYWRIYASLGLNELKIPARKGSVFGHAASNNHGFNCLCHFILV